MHKVEGARRAARLAQFLIAKSIIELLFVAGLAVGFYLTLFPPFLYGVVDEANVQRISGWVVDQSRPQARLEVQLYIDDKFVASQPAEQPRPDVKAAGFAADERHGFSFNTPTLLSGEHVARVYAAHESGGGRRRVLQLVGKPMPFIVK
jgi:hypothetical protein